MQVEVAAVSHLSKLEAQVGTSHLNWHHTETMHGIQRGCQASMVLPEGLGVASQ